MSGWQVLGRIDVGQRARPILLTACLKLSPQQGTACTSKCRETVFRRVNSALQRSSFAVCSLSRLRPSIPVAPALSTAVMSRRKHLLQTLEQEIEPPGDGQHIVRAVGSRGSNIIEVGVLHSVFIHLKSYASSGHCSDCAVLVACRDAFLLPPLPPPPADARNKQFLPLDFYLTGRVP